MNDTAHGLTVLQRTNHYRILRGWVYQDCWVRLADDTVALYSMPDHKLGADL